MSEPRLISPMLDNFIMGGPISDHHGICCCPAMENDTNNRCIVKIISVPASATQVDALLLSGAYPDEEAALTYFRELANGVVQEVKILESLSELEGFIQTLSRLKLGIPKKANLKEATSNLILLSKSRVFLNSLNSKKFIKNLL